ncbi:class I SAM-dependent methyltransferase [Lihuaxuella thermophila]|uniref:Methyltransferase domain-containing protein n=1 Tax=Lihuaxuella thermophila TaxID=1173111 RepID=A0A1H8DCK3_9BACL|nr:class I SAM-dependent methyltransferase [Lihuaxuella thermophila]SEN04886.1 Methyltransferase domain-containing protein [Lihuaxuella thermophila]
MKNKVLAAFSILAKDYEKNVDNESGYNAYYERPAMMKLLPSNMSGLNVLDAGCATSWYTEQFVKLGANVTAVDLSPEMVQAAKRRVGEKASIFVQDLSEPLPFRDETFHLIVSSLTLHYMDDWSSAFREFHRVMKRGGQLVFSVHHPFMDYTMFQRPDYFAQEWLVDEWKKKESGSVKVSFYRRPLHEIINATTEHFTLDRIVEPQPVGEFLEKLPMKSESYDYLMKNPHFLIVQAHK